MAHYAQIHVSGLDFRYEECQKTLTDLLVKTTGIDGRVSVSVQSDASAVVTFPDTPKSSGSQLAQLVLQQNHSLFGVALYICLHVPPQVSSASVYEDEKRASPSSTAGRGRGGKQNQVSAPRDEEPEDPEVRRPRNLSLLPKQTESLPYAGSPPYQPSYHASSTPTHGISSIGPQGHGSNFPGSTANRGDANWLIQPGSSAPSQPWLPNPNWPCPGPPPVQLGPGLPQPRGVYPVRPLGDPRSPPFGGPWYSPPGDPRPPGNLRSPISGGSGSNQSYLSGSGPFVSPPRPSSVWPVGARPAFSSPGNSLQSQSSYNSQNLYAFHSERLQMQQLQLQGNSVSKRDDFVSDAAKALEPKENCIILRGLPAHAERQKVTNVVQEAVLKSSKVEVLELRKEEGGCVAKVHFSNRKGLTAIWKQRHKRKSISYESTPLTFDLLWPEEYEENRFLIENCPSGVLSESFVLHLKAQSILEESKVTPKFIDGGKTAVVFLDDNIVDEEMVNTLNRDASDFKGNDAKLRFRRIPVSRSIRLDRLSKEVDKGSLRNYLFGLPTFPPVPLVETVEISEDLHCNSAIVTLRTTAEKEALLKLERWPELCSRQPKVESHSRYPISAISSVLPQSNRLFELILRAPDDVEEDIMNFIHADRKRDRIFQRQFKLGQLQWNSDTKTLTVSCRQLISPESDYAQQVKDEVSSLCDQYDRKFFCVFDSSLWDRALECALKENSIRGDLSSVKGDYNEKKIWLIGEKKAVSDLHSQCANLVAEWHREKEKREEVIEDSVPCNSKIRLQLLTLCKQYRALSDKVTMNANSDLRRIDIKGRPFEVNSAKEAILRLLGDIRVKVVTVENRLWDFFHGPGLEQLTSALSESQMIDVLVTIEDDHPGVRIVAFRDDVSAACEVVKTLFTCQQIEPKDEEERSYLRSIDATSALGIRCRDLKLQIEGFGEASDEYWVTGRSDNVQKVCSELLKSFQCSVVYSKLLPLREKFRMEYVLNYCKKNIDEIVASLQQYKAKVFFERGSFLLKANRDGLDVLQCKIESLVDGLFTETEELRKHGLQKYVSSEEFKHEKTEIQDEHKVIIVLDEKAEYDADGAACVSGYVDADSSLTSLGAFYAKDSSRIIRLFVGDLCSHEVDAIVNAANETLDFCGGLANVIANRGGYQVQAAIRQVLAKRHGGRLQPGEAVFTSAGSLTTTRFVIHAVGPRWHECNKTMAEDRLREAITAALKEAEKLNLDSVAFPAIGTGIFGCPSDFVAQNMVHVVDQFFSKNSKSTVKRVDFVMREQDTKNIRSFKEELSSKLKKAATPIKMKTRKEAKSVSDRIRVEITGQSKNICRSALGRLKKAVDENCFHRAYKGKIPTAFELNKLKAISDRFEVTLAIDDVLGSDRGVNSPVICVAGKKEEVSEALIGMGQMFTEMMDKELDEVSAALVSPKVIWNWQGDDGMWRPYDKSANAEIEKVYQKAAYNKAKAKFAITINKVKYEIDLQSMFQTSQSTSKRRKIVRKDVEASGAVVEFPSTWSSDVERGEVSVVLLLSSSKEYQDISKNFKATLLDKPGVIQKIERIENPILYRQYSFAKGVLAAKRAKELAARSATLEVELYHGTREDAVQHVIDNGFNRIYAGTSSGQKFGAAVYFAKESGVSHKYALVNSLNEKRMFLCNVLLGLYTEGADGLLEPPVINPSRSKTDRFDSTVDDTFNPRVFVSCYRDNMAYPAYVITFT